MSTAQAVALLAGVLVPFIVDIVTHSRAPQPLKAFLATALAALAGILATTTYTDGADWKVYLRDVFVAWVAAMITHRTRVTDPVQRATANVGIGKPAAS